MSNNYINLLFHRIKYHLTKSKKNIKVYPENKELKISKPKYPKTEYPNKKNSNIVYPPLTPIEESPMVKIIN